MGKIHAARVSQSPRLQRLLDFMRSRGATGATGLEIAHACNVLNPATYLSELRANGFGVECLSERITENGRKVFRYYLRDIFADHS